ADRHGARGRLGGEGPGRIEHRVVDDAGGEMHVDQLPVASVLARDCAPSGLHLAHVAVLEGVGLLRDSVHDPGARGEGAGQVVRRHLELDLVEKSTRSVEQARIVILERIEAHELLIVHGDDREPRVEARRDRVEFAGVERLGALDEQCTQHRVILLLRLRRLRESSYGNGEQDKRNAKRAIASHLIFSLIAPSMTAALEYSQHPEPYRSRHDLRMTAGWFLPLIVFVSLVLLQRALSPARSAPAYARADRWLNLCGLAIQGVLVPGAGYWVATSVLAV